MKNTLVVMTPARRVTKTWLRRLASGDITQAYNSIGGKPWEKIRLPSRGLLWTEPHDSDDAFPPMIDSWTVVNGWVVYKGHNGSVGIVVGTRDELVKWDKNIQLQQKVTPKHPIVPYNPTLHGGWQFAQQARRTAEKVLRSLGVSADIDLYYQEGGRTMGEANGSSLSLFNVHVKTKGDSYLGFRIPSYIQVAAHEAAHLGYHKGGRHVIPALKAYRKRTGKHLSMYHSLAGDFEGVMEAASIYALAPEVLQLKAPEVYEAVRTWFKGRKV